MSLDDDIYEDIGNTRFAAREDVRNILVTGGAGFVGGWLVRHLVISYPEYHVVCYDNLGYCSSRKNISMLEDRPNFTFIKGDIVDPAGLEKALYDHKIDTVFHLAAESHVDLSFNDPYRFTYTNVIGTQVVLEKCILCKVKRVIHMSTDEVYGEIKQGSADLTETSILTPTNPYAASKASSDMLVYAYQKSFGLPAMVVRCNNIYGPHQYPEKIIPKFISLIQRGRKCILHGNGSNTRRYLFVADAVGALDTTLHKGQIGCIYNAGTSEEKTNLEIALTLLTLFNIPREKQKDHIEFTQNRPFNDARYGIDSNEISKLGWYPKVKFEKGIQMTVDWYEKYGDTWWGDISKVLTAFPSPAVTPFRPGDYSIGHQHQPYEI